MKPVVISASLDDLRSRGIRLLHEASKLGPLHVVLWGDDVVKSQTGSPPKFPAAERKYFVENIRYVSTVTIADRIPEPDALPAEAVVKGGVWVMPEPEATAARHDFCRQHGMELLALSDAALEGFPPLPEDAPAAGTPRERVIVTGCYDWFHTGHVRFFEEVSALGDLYVSLGHDANIRLLKGEGHPLLPQDERRYVVQSIRFVKRALISSGTGWLDAEPEIRVLKPQMYAVNEDGDKPEKRQYCEANGIRYVVLKRTPKEGLPRRQSTDLRGF
jgi:cytidyltransferase-like protein